MPRPGPELVHPAVPGRAKFSPPLAPAPLAPITGTWAQLGPQPIAGSGACCANTSPPSLIAAYGNVAGRVTSIATDPTNAAVVYAGTAGGGVWKSTDGGSNWVDTSSALASLAGADGASAIGAIAIDPTTPSTVYAGTGEDNLSDSQAGWGILKSTDAGATWTIIGSGTFARQHIGGLLVDSTNSLHIFAATDIGLFASTDGGTTWNKITINGIHNISGKTATQAATQIIQDPNTPTKFWVTVSDFCNGDAGDIFTGDGNTNWTAVNFHFAGVASRIGLAVTKGATASTAYFSAADCAGDLTDMEKTIDGGTTWTLIPISSATSGIFNYFNAGGGGQGDYDNVVAIDPVNPLQVVFGGVWGIATTDGGTTFKDITRVYNGGVVHPDMHAVAFTAANSFYLGSDGGVWTTTDAGGVLNVQPGMASDWVNRNSTFATAVFYGGSALDSTHIFGGAQDNGSPGKLPGGAPSPAWQEYLDGDGGRTAIDPTAGSTTLYAEVPHLDIYKGSSTITSGPASPYDSFNEAGPCRLNFNSGDPACTDPRDFVGPFVMDPTNANILLAGTNKVYLTRNGGGSGGPSGWTAISGDVTTGSTNFVSRPDTLSVIGMGPSGLGGPIITGSRFGAVFFTLNGSTAGAPSWVNITGNLPGPSLSPTTNTFVFANPWISGAVVNPSNPSEAWVSIGGINTFTVWHTLNAGAAGGTQWNELSGVAPPSLGNESVNALVLDPTSSRPTALYVGTDTGVFVCDPCNGAAADTTATWSRVGSGLPNVKVNALTFSRDQRVLIAWTHGRGAFGLPVSGWDKLGGVLASRPVSSSWTFNGTTRLDSFVRGTDNQIWHSSYDGTNWQWDNATGAISSDVSVVATPPVGATPGFIDVYARGTDSSLVRARFTVGTGWAAGTGSTSWTSVGGKLAAEPSAAAVGSGQNVVFVQGTDNHLWAWSSTTGWQPGMGGVLAAAPAAVSAGTEYDAFVEGTDHALWYWSSASSWHGAGGAVAAKPAAVSWGAGRLDAFVQATDGGLRHWTNSGSGWEVLGGRLASRPAAVTWGSPELDVLVQGTDNNLWHARNTGTGGWQWDQVMGAQLSIDPSITSPALNRIDIFLRSTDSSLWHRSLP